MFGVLLIARPHFFIYYFVTIHYICITFSLGMEYWAIFYAQFNKNFKLASLKHYFLS